MSALGQKQTYAVQNGMSALPPIATSIAYLGMGVLKLGGVGASSDQHQNISVRDTGHVLSRVVGL